MSLNKILFIAAFSMVALASSRGLARTGARQIKGKRSGPSPIVAVNRQDVAASFGAQACAPVPDDLPLTAWRSGVFDAQIDGRRSEPFAGRSPSLEELTRKGHALASVRRFAGYAAGVCKDGSGWAVALPAPAPLVVDRSGVVALPKILASACESFRVDFAPAAGGAAKELGATLRVDPKGLGDGVLGVTCQPPRPRFQGPVLWYLVPVGRGPGATPPAVEALTATSGGDDAERLMTWVNAVRRSETLKPVIFKREMREEASVLEIDPTLMHDRAMLRKVGASLEAANVRLIGEDRVKGRSLASMAWLLWNSPRHRELILNKSATAAGLAIRETRGEQLAVLVFGEDQPIKTAKAKRHRPTAPSPN